MRLLAYPGVLFLVLILTAYVKLVPLEVAGRIIMIVLLAFFGHVTILALRELRGNQKPRSKRSKSGHTTFNCTPQT